MVDSNQKETKPSVQLVLQLRAKIAQLEAEIDATWFMIDNGWDVEPRAYFEKEAPTNGFHFPLAQAIHHLWKRRVKDRGHYPVIGEQVVKLMAQLVRRRMQFVLETPGGGSDTVRVDTDLYFADAVDHIMDRIRTGVLCSDNINDTAGPGSGSTDGHSLVGTGGPAPSAGGSTTPSLHPAPRSVCILNCDSPSYPPDDDERRQCGCTQCLSYLAKVDK